MSEPIRDELSDLLDHARELSRGTMPVNFQCRNAAEKEEAKRLLKRKKHAKMVTLVLVNQPLLTLDDLA